MKIKYFLNAYWKCLKHGTQRFSFYITLIVVMVTSDSWVVRLAAGAALLALFPVALIIASWVLLQYFTKPPKH